MTVHRNHITALPVNTSRNYCLGCWTPPGRDHGLACPMTAPQPTLRALLDELRPVIWLVGLITVCLLLWAIVLAPIALLIWS